MKTSRTSPYTILIVDEAGRIRGADGNVSLTDPTGYKKNEARFETSTAPRRNPLRLDAGYRVTRQGEGVDEEGNPIFVTEIVDWLDCIMDGLTVREMTEQEKADRDAFYEAEEINKELIRQNAKPMDLKIAENNFILICDAVREALGQDPTRTTLDTPTFMSMVEQIKVVNFEVASELSLKSLASIHEVEIRGGRWSDTIWHSEVE